MSLRLRLFILIGGLVALLVVAQWWWARVLARDLSSEIDEVASAVGHSVAAFFSDVEAAPQGQVIARKVVKCLGEDCEDVEVLEEDVELTRRDDVAAGESEADGVPGKVVIQRFGSGADGGTRESDDVVAYAFHHRTADDPDVERRIETHVKLHVEHQDGARYLWLAGPSVERRFQIPEGGISDKLERFSRRLVLGSAGFLVLGLALAGVVAHRVTTPLRQLSDAARRLGEGALGTRVPAAAAGEVGQALAAFNRMSGRLEELDRRNRELSARKHLGEIGEISRGLAHTLRNPLNALGLSVEELAAGSGGAEASALAESARRQIRRIDSSLKSFLALASQSGGVLAEVDLGELVQDVALEALQDSRGKVRLELGSFEGLPRLRAVEPELRAVLQALVVNAVEASPAGGRVTVRASAPRYSAGPPPGGHSAVPPPGESSAGPPPGESSAGPPPGGRSRWRLEIDDEGPGLPPEVRARLFTPHLSTKANGSGMGLFLAHRIATGRYRGSLELIDIEAEDGEVRGTRAVLEIGERQEIEGSADG